MRDTVNFGTGDELARKGASSRTNYLCECSDVSDVDYENVRPSGDAEKDIA